MTRHLVICLTISALTFASPAPAAAYTYAFYSVVYDTVDAIEVSPGVSYPRITITGITSGNSVPNALTYQIYTSGASGVDDAARCDRLALLAMTKPGKYQLAMNSINTVNGWFTCKLIVRTP